MHAPRVATVEHAPARALSYLLLTGFVVVVYVVVVLGGGAALGSDDAHPNVALSVLATSVVAVAWEPMRRRVTLLVRHLTGDTKPTPYETLGRLSRQAAGSYAIDEVAPRIAHVLATGIGAALAEVWLRIGDELHLAATWSAGTAGVPASSAVRAAAAPLGTPALAVDPPADAVVPVTYAGELLGALVVRRPQEALTPVELTLVDDLARQAALVLRNVILARELEGRLGELATRAAELAASRARLVAAQDEERRRLERDIHDGAQQHLVALVVQLRLVQALLEREPERAVQLVHDLREGVRNADQTIQDLVRGIRPPALRENGLVAALREVATTIPVLVEVTGTDRRYREELEATAYFCCVEAISNAVKHAAATTVTVTVRAQDDELAFAVRDDGAGFDPGRAPRGRGLSNIADRVEAVGGSFRVASSPGTGTWVEGRLPLRSGTVVATEPETALLTRSDTT